MNGSDNIAVSREQIKKRKETSQKPFRGSMHKRSSLPNYTYAADTGKISARPSLRPGHFVRSLLHLVYFFFPPFILYVCTYIYICVCVSTDEILLLQRVFFERSRGRETESAGVVGCRPARYSESRRRGRKIGRRPIPALYLTLFIAVPGHFRTGNLRAFVPKIRFSLSLSLSLFLFLDARGARANAYYYYYYYMQKFGVR